MLIASLLSATCSKMLRADDQIDAHGWDRPRNPGYCGSRNDPGHSSSERTSCRRRSGDGRQAGLGSTGNSIRTDAACAAASNQERVTEFSPYDASSAHGVTAGG